MKSSRFKGPKKYIEYLLARSLVVFLQRLPITCAYRFGRVFGWVCWKLFKRRCDMVRMNLEIVNKWLAENPDSVGDHSAFKMPIEAQVREVFQRNGANLFSGFTFARMSSEQVEKHIQVEGIEGLRAALAEDRGAVVLLAHMGPWEALAQLPGMAKQNGIEAPFGAMYRPLNNFYLDDWYRTQREAQGTRLYSRRDGFHKPVDFIRNGCMLGVLADQKMTQGERVGFFGCEVSGTPLPGLFYMRSGAPLVAIALISVGPMRWKILIRRIHDFEKLTDRSRFATSQLTSSIMEDCISKSPLDYFWFHDRFGIIRKRDKKRARKVSFGARK